jgi:hypothetical protein
MRSSIVPAPSSPLGRLQISRDDSPRGRVATISPVLLRRSSRTISPGTSPGLLRRRPSDASELPDDASSISSSSYTRVVAKCGDLSDDVSSASSSFNKKGRVRSKHKGFFTEYACSYGEDSENDDASTDNEGSFRSTASQVSTPDKERPRRGDRRILPSIHDQARTRRSNSATLGKARARSGRRMSVPGGRKVQPIEERAATVRVDKVLADVMGSYKSLELELADDGQVLQLASALRINSSVTSLNLSYNRTIRDTGLIALAEALEENKTLLKLNLSGCTGFTDAAAAQLLRRVDRRTNLQTLNFTGCVEVGDQFATQLAASLPNDRLSEGIPGLQLREVNLSGCKSLSDTGVSEIGSALSSSMSLTSLVLQGCHRITDSAVATLARGLSSNPALELLDLSWLEELSDDSAVSLAAALRENRRLTTLLLVCCVRITDAGGKALAAALERNAVLTSLDLSWCVKLGHPTLAALTQAMARNYTVTTLELTGCRCMDKHNHVHYKDVDGDRGSAAAVGAPSSPRMSIARVSRQSVVKGPPLAALLQRNRSAPRVPMTLANSALLSADKTSESFRPSGTFGRRGLITSPAELLQTMRGAIMTGAALYNADDAEGCFKLFVQTAESIVATIRSPVVAEALQKATSIYASTDMQQQLWTLRTSFDALVDELEEAEERNADSVRAGALDGALGI